MAHSVLTVTKRSSLLMTVSNVFYVKTITTKHVLVYLLVFDTMRTINLQAGWVCRQCRTNFNGMQSALSRANEEIADMRVSIA